MSKYILTGKGEDFIIEKCGTGVSMVQGNNNYVLPYANPPISPNYIWVSDSNINGGISDNTHLAGELINWYNYYGGLYDLDPNIMVAQAFNESGFKIWNYSKTGALGLTQFLAGTLWDVIISNNYGDFTNDERMAITKNIDGYIFSSTRSQPKTPFYTGYDSGRLNRAQLHQNIIDNPKIMIKAQFVYMRHTTKLANGIASCALFGYNRGPDFIKGGSYTNTILDTISRKGFGYEIEGINYVYKIFKLLYDKFGVKYKVLNITDNGKANFNNFDSTLA